MRRLVSTVSPSLALLLERDLLQRADLHLVTARSIDELVTLIREGAEMCLVEALLPDGDALDALDAVRATREGSRVPVVLVRTSDAPPQDTSAFSAVLELPTSAGAVEDVLGKLLETPRRRGLRRATSARARDERGQPLGRIVDIARGGIALRTRKPLQSATTLPVSLELPLQRAPIAATVRVLRIAGDHVALALESPSPMLSQALEILVVPPPIDGGLSFRPLPQLGERTAAIGGAFVDGPARAALSAFFAATGAPGGKLVVTDLLPFDDEGIDRWIALVDQVGQLGPVELYGCAPWLRALGDRCPSVFGRGATRARIVSLDVALRCAACGDESESEVWLPTDRAGRLDAIRTVAEAPCFVCGGAPAPVEPLELVAA